MIICLDTETTGLNPKQDQILELAIVDGNGDKLLHERYKPTRLVEWPEAQAVHGISPQDVANCPSIDRDREKIMGFINSAELVVGYNIRYDLNMLWGEGIYRPDIVFEDIMPTFAELYGEYDFWRGGYQWQKLVTAADYFHYVWDGKAHGALADTKATLFVWQKLKELGLTGRTNMRKGAVA